MNSRHRNQLPAAEPPAREPLELPGNQLLVSGRSVAGWVGGNVQLSVAFSLFAGVRPIVEEFPLERAGEAYEKMMSSTVHFRAVLCPTLGTESQIEGEGGR